MNCVGTDCCSCNKGTDGPYSAFYRQWPTIHAAAHVGTGHNSTTRADYCWLQSACLPNAGFLRDTTASAALASAGQCWGLLRLVALFACSSTELSALVPAQPQFGLCTWSETVKPLQGNMDVQSHTRCLLCVPWRRSQTMKGETTSRCLWQIWKLGQPAHWYWLTTQKNCRIVYSKKVTLACGGVFDEPMLRSNFL